MRYQMRLRSVGNPDFNQYAPVSDPETVEGSTLEEMRDFAEAYRDKWGLGGGNWPNPVVKEKVGDKLKPVGFFSYNGKLWETGPKNVDILDRKEIPVGEQK